MNGLRVPLCGTGFPPVLMTQLRKFATRYMTAFPDQNVYLDDLLEKHGRVIDNWTLAGTNTGPGGTGKPVRISGLEEWRIGDDGLVTESLGNFDAGEYALTRMSV